MPTPLRRHAPASAYKVPLISQGSYLAADLLLPSLAGMLGSSLIWSSVMTAGDRSLAATGKKATRITSGLVGISMAVSISVGILMQKELDAEKAALEAEKRGSNNKNYNKIIGHHPGWANKNTEAAIGSDFTAGSSWTGMAGNALEAAFVVASGLSSYNRTRSLKAGFAGMAAAGLGIFAKNKYVEANPDKKRNVNLLFNSMMATSIMPLVGPLSLEGGMLQGISRGVKAGASKSSPYIKKAGEWIKPRIPKSIMSKVGPGSRVARYAKAIQGHSWSFSLSYHQVKKYGSISSVPAYRSIGANFLDVTRETLESSIFLYPVLMIGGRGSNNKATKKKGSNNKPINKIIGHHPGWANKQTEVSIDSDFTAGQSYTGNEKQRKKVPWIQHSLLVGAAFMTVFDRTGSAMQGLKGAGAAGAFIGARHIARETLGDWANPVDVALGATEFSAITSLLGSSAMRGGFLYRPVGKPIQRAIATRGFSKLYEKLPWKIKEHIYGAKSTTHAARMLQLKIRSSKAEIGSIVSDVASETAKRKGIFGKLFLKFVGGQAKNIAEGTARVTEEYAGIGLKYLRKIGTGGRGPFEATAGVFDLSKRALQAMENPAAEMTNIMNLALGRKKWLLKPMKWVSKKFGNDLDSIPLLDEMRKGPIYKGAKGVVKYRKYFEGIFGSPSVGELAGKHGSIKNIPLNEYFGANLKDVYYGAAPGVIVASPFIAFSAISAGIKGIGRKISGDEKHGSNNKPINKIIGHHPGWANKETEAAIDSDFTAGQSWTSFKDALQMFARNRKRSVVSGMLAATLATTPTSVALAKTAAGTAVKKASSVAVASATKYSKYLSAIDDVVALTDKNPIVRARAKSLLVRTGVHESAGLKYTKQLGGGPARGYFQIEHATSKDIVKRYAARPDKKQYMDILEKFSGMPRKELLGLDKEALNSLVETNARFGASVARLKYKMAPQAIPAGLEAQSEYWGKYYQTSASAKKQAQFIVSNKSYSSAMASNVNRVPANTVGLTNNVLHGKKISHTIIDPIEKTKHLFKI